MDYVSQLATTTEAIGAIGADVLATVLMAVGIVLGIWVVLVGIGYAVRLIRKHVTGRAFK